LITDSLFFGVALCIALLAAWPRRKWLLTDLVMIAIVVETTMSAGMGAGTMYVLMSLIMFTAYFAVGCLGALSTLRDNKQFSFKVLTPILDRLLRAGLIVLSIPAVFALMVILKAI